MSNLVMNSQGDYNPINFGSGQRQHLPRAMHIGKDDGVQGAGRAIRDFNRSQIRDKGLPGS